MIRYSTYVERSSVTLGAMRSHNHVNLSVELQIGEYNFLMAFV
jgi:hypothetical protein